MKFLISFGQAHTHRINGMTYDCDSLLEVDYPDEITARISLNMELKQWCGIYKVDEVNQSFLALFPRGVLNAGDPVTF